jgi:hypothetical protein
MRFSNLITLLAASSALAYTVKRDEFEDEAQNLAQVADAATVEGGIDTAEDNPTDPFAQYKTDECEPFASDIEKCFGVEDKSANEVCKEFSCDTSEPGYDEICTQFNSQECQEVIKKDLSACIPFNINVASYRLTCTRDEKGEYCPISVLQQNGGDYSETVMQETCKSKLCAENALEGFKQLKKNVETVSTLTGENVNANDYNAYIDALSKKECAASAASHIKVGSALVFTLALVLSYF